MTDEYVSEYIVDLVMKTRDRVRAIEESGNGWKRSMPRDVYRREFKTIRIKLPRRMGTSTAAVRLFDEATHAVVFFPTYNILQYTIELFDLSRDLVRTGQFKKVPEHVGFASQEVQHFAQDVIKLKKSDDQYDFVIFDVTSHMKEDVVEQLLELYDEYTEFFVLLG